MICVGQSSSVPSTIHQPPYFRSLSMSPGSLLRLSADGSLAAGGEALQLLHPPSPLRSRMGSALEAGGGHA